MLKRTPFHDFHVSAGARLVDFAGWEMPLLYRSIVEEHEHTRRNASVFDVSHMGRLLFSGPDAQRFLNHVLTRNVADQSVGQSRYSLVCNQAGGILDDVIVSRGEEDWLLVCNASNRDKLLSYFTQVRGDSGFDVEMTDSTESTAMVAIQGPLVIDKLAQDLTDDIRHLKRYHFLVTSIMFVRVMIFRSGYTGEDGVELIVPAKVAGMAMKMIGASLNKPGAAIRPAGLGARDTLRLEAGMPLYGHELNEHTDPFSAGLAWAVDLTKPFIGHEALRTIHHHGPARKLVGLVLDGKRIARHGADVTRQGRIIGQVTSGSFGPTVGKSIAMAYVEAPLAAPGTQLTVDLKGSAVPASVVKLPFYKRGSA